MNLLKSWAFRLFAPLGVMAVLAGLIIGRAGPRPSQEPAISQDTLLSAPASFRSPQIQRTLVDSGSPLASYHELVGSQSLSAADIFWTASQGERYGISPRALMTTFAVENGGLTWAHTSGLFAYLKTIATRLAALEAEPVSPGSPDTGGLLLPAERNPASAALARYLAPDAKLAGTARTSLQAWSETYRKLFAESAQTFLLEQPAAVQPFLRLPFDQPSHDFYPVESFFDHSTPGSSSEPALTRFDGKTLPGALFKNCWNGVTCYSGHNGIDYPMPAGTPIYAAAAGTVILRYDYEGGLIIDHGNGYRSMYWHLDKILVNLDQPVTDGQLLGVSGNRGLSTSPHLHFAVRLAALSRDIDPYGWWAPTPDPWPTPSRWLWRGGLVADSGTAQSQLFFTQYWKRDPHGYGGDAWYAQSANSFGASTNWGMWGASLPSAGNYQVFANWPKNPENTSSAIYQIWHAGGVSSITVSQRDDGDGWVSLGTFAFNQGPAVVILTDQTRDSNGRKRVYFDAVQWVPAGSTIYIPAAPAEGK